MTCKCGCGQETRVRRDGTARDYVHGHNNRKGLKWTVSEDGCWIWGNQISTNGYGRVRDYRSAGTGREMKAHVLMYEMTVGPVPVGMFLDHTCHDPKACKGGPTCPHRACVNPAHLEPVTPAENSRRGHVAKLTAEIVRMVRASAEDDKTLGARFGVSHVTISDIRSNRSWADVQAVA